MSCARRWWLGCVLTVVALSVGHAGGEERAVSDVLPGAQTLTMEGDLAAQMVAGIDRFLTRELAASPQSRQAHWNRDTSSAEAYVRSVSQNRERLAKVIGLVDERLPFEDLELVATLTQPSLVAQGDGYSVHAVRWPVLPGVWAEGLLLDPEADPVARVIALPDADQTPEMLVGLAPGIVPGAQFARRLAENGCHVIIPALIDRSDTFSGNPEIRMTNQPHREFIYRMAFELGRHIIGYEVQEVLAAVDWCASQDEGAGLAVGVFGYGEGGLLALHSAAVDPRIDATVVSGYFGPREDVWREPIYRNVWSLLHEFGDAELASLVAPRTLIIEASHGPELKGPPPPRDGRAGAAPGVLASPSVADVRSEVERARKLLEGLAGTDAPRLIVPDDGLPGSEDALTAFIGALTEQPSVDVPLRPLGAAPGDGGNGFDPQARLRRVFDGLCDWTQGLMRRSEGIREGFWSETDPSSPEGWAETCRPLRDYLWDEVIGRLPERLLAPSPQARQILDQPGWTAYEIVLDVYPDVFAYGILLLPKDIEAGERRPVVVCQHGLEGRPQSVLGPEVEGAYRAYAAQLADRGFVVYAPQNPYIGQDDFRVLQRKANPLKLSLFSFIVRQHEQTLNWLKEQPFVDPDRIGFYGLSYGGKTAVRVPALLEDYCLSICSGDFNEWIFKNATVDHRMSYIFTGEYEMFEFDLGSTFNYSELAALIAPRPFMVERGHRDGVSVDEWVAYEYAKVRRLYDEMGIGDRTAIEFFNGGHWINGQGTFEFLHRHLDWPEPAE